jgi:defect-in-organelle-trafficking protein DotD
MIKHIHIAKGFALAAAVALLAGCASNETQQESQVLEQNHYVLVSDLNQSAQKVSASLQQLAMIEKASGPTSAPLPFVKVKASALQQTMTLNWSGPIAPVVRQVAAKMGWSVQVLGKLPVTPVLVNLNGTSTVKDMLQNIDLQAGQNASVMLLPKYKLVSLRYTEQS